ncbi:MAG: Na+/H+ antiporter NhaC family protein [Oligosphaeraceae bacterium]
MKVRTSCRLLPLALLLLGLFSLAPEFLGQEAAVVEAVEEAAAPGSPFVRTFWALVPPIIAIGLALLTKEVYSSLFIGILCGGFLSAGFSRPLVALDTVVSTGLIDAVSGGAGIFIFLVILGVMAALITRTGAAAAFGRWAHKNVRSRTGACLATFLLGILIFIDDYFNCLTVGNVMRPVTDANRISRAKLAYLIDATAAPVCMIAPISSWAAAVADFTKGTGYNGIQLFIRAIPYNFYSLLTFLFILGIIFLRFDYGPMARHERNAMETGDLFTEGEEVDSGLKVPENAKGHFLDLLIPVVLLVVVSILALLRVGGYGVDGAGLVDAFGNTDATVGLPWGGLLVLLFTIVYLVARRVISPKEAMKCVPEGFVAMVPAIMILVLATSLKNVTGTLELKEYIAGLMEGNASSLGNFLPAVIFLVACFLSFSTGTSWGTFGILIPIICNIFPGGGEIMIIGMSACLAGAVCGDHCSPISDTTIMSSAGARCQHINHVSTQLPYSLTVAVISFVGFLLAGIVKSWFIAFPVTVAVLLFTLLVLRHFVQKKAA